MRGDRPHAGLTPKAHPRQTLTSDEHNARRQAQDGTRSLGQQGHPHQVNPGDQNRALPLISRALPGNG